MIYFFIKNSINFTDSKPDAFIVLRHSDTAQHKLRCKENTKQGIWFACFVIFTFFAVKSSYLNDIALL